jgi:hypothetical protein
MDMKKILQALDGVSAKPAVGVNDMKKFVSIIRESSDPKSVEETVISSFEAGSVGGDANEYLLAADKINDEVMAQVERIKINADESLLRDMMTKFNAFMTSYHAVGKDILQPDMFKDSLGEQGVAEVSQQTLQSYRKKAAKEKNDAMDIVNRDDVDDATWAKNVNKASKRKDGINAANKRLGVGEGLSFTDYVNLAEAKQKGVDGKACWDGYKRMGTKKKGGKTVDNCVPTGKK